MSEWELADQGDGGLRLLAVGAQPGGERPHASAVEQAYPAPLTSWSTLNDGRRAE